MSCQPLQIIDASLTTWVVSAERNDRSATVPSLPFFRSTDGTHIVKSDGSTRFVCAVGKYIKPGGSYR
ncbi:MAG TPA: hypothetical protein VGN90_05230 [Pyrinomonadaceae bacterium]|nr:hypothetical protein [Pyrinomonadaceae bacterium]